MESVIICTFNVENLFMRYKIFGFTASPKPFRNILTAEELKEGGGFLPTPKWKKSFQLYDKGPWRELTAAAIRRAEPNDISNYSMPDILCLQEVESMDALRLFNEKNLDNHYKYQILIDSNDPRRIDVGLLSNSEIKSIITHMYEKSESDNKSLLFSRDCLEITFKITNTKDLTVYINHLKSKFVNPNLKPQKREEQVAEANKLRLQQSRKVIQLVSNRFKNDKFETENFVVLGDFNDSPDSPCLKPLLHETSRMHNVVLRLDPHDRWTYWYDRKNIASQIDYILLSPSLDGNSSSKPYIERRGISNKIKRFSYLNEKKQENKIEWNFPRFQDVSEKYEASDHCPVFFELQV